MEGGSPLQCSGLGNLMVRGAWWAAATVARVKHDLATTPPPPPPPLTGLNLSLIHHFQHANLNPSLMPASLHCWTPVLAPSIQLLLAKAPQAACDQATTRKYQSGPPTQASSAWNPLLIHGLNPCSDVFCSHVLLTQYLHLRVFSKLLVMID